MASVSASGGRIPADSLTHVALVGRSNVGKSSLINALTGRALARTSAAPGKTRLVNIYRVELATGRGRIALYLVDLPGYGYARGGSRAADELRAVAEAYFSSRGSGFGARDPQAGGSGSRESRTAGPGPRGSALLLVDSRHPRLESDLQAARWLDSMGVTTHIAATKIDKLTRSERARNLTAIGDSFGTAVQPVSAANGEGLDALWRTIVRIARDEGRGG